MFETADQLLTRTPNLSTTQWYRILPQNTMPPLLKCRISIYFLMNWHVASGGIFPETLFLTVLLKLSVPDSRKCLGKPRVNMKWNLNLEKMPPLLKQRITRKFLVKWHFACGGIFRETLLLQNRRGQGENIEQNHHGSYWNIEKVIVAIQSFAIVSWRDSIFEAASVILGRSNDRRIGR